MGFTVRFMEEAEADLLRLYYFILARDVTGWAVAELALEAIRGAVRSLERSLSVIARQWMATPFLRELVIPFGAVGYVALFEIDSAHMEPILAVWHQREDDFH